MKHFLIMMVGMMAATTFSATQDIELSAMKDTFGRSNERNLNNGASKHLIVAHSPNIRTIVAFDLSGVTNEIAGAEFKIHQQNSMPDPITLVIAPMAQTENNAAWGEGAGALGTKGQNSRPGDACYVYSAFRDTPWESANGEHVISLGDPKLWETRIATLDNQEWTEGKWITVPVPNVSVLEQIRKSEHQTVTIGLWGMGGQGLYNISSKESEHAPKLILKTKEGKGG